MYSAHVLDVIEAVARDVSHPRRVGGVDERIQPSWTHSSEALCGLGGGATGDLCATRRCYIVRPRSVGETPPIDVYS